MTKAELELLQTVKTALQWENNAAPRIDDVAYALGVINALVMIGTEQQANLDKPKSPVGCQKTTQCLKPDHHLGLCTIDEVNSNP